MQRKKARKKKARKEESMGLDWKAKEKRNTVCVENVDAGEACFYNAGNIGYWCGYTDGFYVTCAYVKYLEPGYVYPGVGFANKYEFNANFGFFEPGCSGYLCCEHKKV